MPPSQDEIRVVPTDSERNPVVMVDGKEVVVSSATEKPDRSFWVAWMYIFDVSIAGRRYSRHPLNVCSGTRVITLPKRRN
jgi:hypothetical protein